MRNDEKTNKALTLMGLSILAMANGGDAGQFSDAIRMAVMEATGLIPSQQQETEPFSNASSDYCYGIRGLADYLGVSTPTAQKYKDSGILDGAIRKVGRKYSFLKSKVDEAFATK